MSPLVNLIMEALMHCLHAPRSYFIKHDLANIDELSLFIRCFRTSAVTNSYDYIITELLL